MATPKKTPSKPRPKKPAAAKASTFIQGEGPRQLKPPKRRLLKRQAKRFKARPKLPSSFVITKKASRLLLSNWRIIGGIVLLYGVLNIVLVRGLNGGTNVTELKNSVDTLFSSTVSGHVLSGLTVFGLLFSSSNSTATSDASAYQTILLLIASLALVWTYRQLLADIKVRVRDGFYRGMTPLIPVLLVLLVVGLELIPLIIGAWLYSILIQNGIAITGLEQTLTLLISLSFAAISVYLLCSTMFALYIAALPEMTPLRAMRSARELVRYRRWPIIRKLLFLPLVLVLATAIIMLPFILFAAVIAQWIFFLLTMIMLAAVHAYMYTLYRELLNE